MSEASSDPSPAPTYRIQGRDVTLPCRVREHNPGAPLFEATYWHNSLYNTSLPAGVQVIGFQPDWSEAEADPPL